MPFQLVILYLIKWLMNSILVCIRGATLCNFCTCFFLKWRSCIIGFTTLTLFMLAFHMLFTLDPHVLRTFNERFHTYSMRYICISEVNSTIPTLREGGSSQTNTFIYGHLCIFQQVVHLHSSISSFVITPRSKSSPRVVTSWRVRASYPARNSHLETFLMCCEGAKKMCEG
jgi:hypothetical protein